MDETKKAMAEFEMDSNEVGRTGKMTHEDRNHIIKWPFMDDIVVEDHRWILHIIHYTCKATDQLRETMCYVEEYKGWMTGRGYGEVWYWIDLAIDSMVELIYGLNNHD